MMKPMLPKTNSEICEYLKAKDKRLGRLIDYFGEIQHRKHENVYEFIVKEIVGQMLSNKVADTICHRLDDLCGNNINPDRIIQIGEAALHGIGISEAKTRYILTFSKAVEDGTLDLEQLPSFSDTEIMKRLMSIRGIGTWTAKMYLLFVLDRPNVLPWEDGAFKQSFRWLYNIENPSREDIEAKCQKWSPYSSVAARYMYRALDAGLTKKPFRLHGELK